MPDFSPKVENVGIRINNSLFFTSLDAENLSQQIHDETRYLFLPEIEAKIVAFEKSYVDQKTAIQKLFSTGRQPSQSHKLLIMKAEYEYKHAQKAYQKAIEYANHRKQWRWSK